MTKLLPVICPLILLIFQPAVCYATDITDTERILSVELPALDGDLMSMSQWDMSQLWIVSDRNTANVKVYGDTLLAETFNGRRSWYAIECDSIFFKGVEDRLSSIYVDSLIHVGYRPIHPGDTEICSFTASGTVGGRKFAVNESGTIVRQSIGKPGRLILSAGDTIPRSILVREVLSFTATFAADSINHPCSYKIETYRWYDYDCVQSLLPVAVQRSVFISDKTGQAMMPAVSSLFVRDRSDFKTKPDKSNVTEIPLDLEALRDAIHSANVTIDSRQLTVSMKTSAPNLPLSIDVMDTGGRLYLHDEHFTSDTARTFYLDCSGVRSGEYVVAIILDAGEIITEKRYIKIR